MVWVQRAKAAITTVVDSRLSSTLDVAHRRGRAKTCAGVSALPPGSVIVGDCAWVSKRRAALTPPPRVLALVAQRSAIGESGRRLNHPGVRWRLPCAPEGRCGHRRPMARVRTVLRSGK